MKNVLKNIVSKAKNAKLNVVSVGTAVLTGAAMSVNTFATETTGISINFDPTQMFTYSNVIISCLMPVVYITAGLSLGFTVIYALKNAFGSRM